MSDFLERLMVEREELRAKMHKLRLFLCSDKFLEIDKIQQDLLSIQIDTMNAYLSVLTARIELL